jgi:hypothetical protein
MQCREHVAYVNMWMNWFIITLPMSINSKLFSLAQDSNLNIGCKIYNNLYSIL